MWAVIGLWYNVSNVCREEYFIGKFFLDKIFFDLRSPMLSSKLFSDNILRQNAGAD